jgi:hypothetical protein
MSSPIRVASGQGFWGDLHRAPIDQARKGPIDYLVMDYLAEVTMSILHKQKARDPSRGYATDFPDVVAELLPLMQSHPFKVISNGGGANPEACRQRILSMADQQNVRDLEVAVVTGDDIVDRLDELLQEGISLEHLETGAPFSTVREEVISANAYLGAPPIVKALREGADIVVTGRTTDAALTLAPLIYEFDWPLDNSDLMAAGVVAGHLLECGAQSSGGNFTDWKAVPDLARIGFPIAEVHADGSFVLTKHDDTGGLVNAATLKEQLIYEIADPSNYLTPDCIADFTSVDLTEEAKNRVRVTGARGREAPREYKVSASYHAGWKATGTLVYPWPEAAEKARAAADIVKTCLNVSGITLDAFRTELIVLNVLAGAPASSFVDEAALNEVMLRISVRDTDREAVARFGREIVPLVLTGPPGATGYAGGRPKPSELFAYWPTLVPKDVVKANVTVASD